jgi:coiled-coil domain-containing protein 12
MDERKARLAALSAKAGRNKQPSVTNNYDSNQERNVVQFRNYTPSDPTLDITSDEPASKRIKATSQEKSVLEKALEMAKAELPEIRGDEDVVAAAPKKINADLKREILPKLQKLERRTHKAIVALLRERLEREADAGLD